MPRPRASRRSQAFSLIELLVVIALLILIAGFSTSALRGLAEGSRQERAVIGISSALEAARQAAVARGTYTWVALDEGTTDSDQPVVSVAAFASKDGTRGSSVASANNVSLLSKVEKFESVKLEADPDALTDFGGYVLSQSEVDTPDDADFVPPLDGLPEEYGDKSFDWVVMFTPRGAAAIEKSDDSDEVSGSDSADGDNIRWTKKFIQFGVVSCKGDSPTETEEKAAAAIQVNTLDGQVAVYRAEAGGD